MRGSNQRISGVDLPLENGLSQAESDHRERTGSKSHHLATQLSRNVSRDATICLDG
jgi:hypothetical protein